MTDKLPDITTVKAESAIPASSPDNNQTVGQAIANAAADCYGFIAEAAGNHYVQVAAAGAAAFGLVAITRGRAVGSVVEELGGATKRASSIGIDSLGGEFHGPLSLSKEVAGGGRLTFPRFEELLGGRPTSLSLQHPGLETDPALEAAARAARTRGIEIAERVTGGAGKTTGATEKVLPLAITDLGGNLDSTSLAAYTARMAVHPPASGLGEAFRFLTEGKPATSQSLSVQFPGTAQSDSVLSDLARRAAVRGIEVSGR